MALIELSTVVELASDPRALVAAIIASPLDDMAVGPILGSIYSVEVAVVVMVLMALFMFVWRKQPGALHNLR